MLLLGCNLQVVDVKGNHPASTCHQVRPPRQPVLNLHRTFLTAHSRGLLREDRVYIVFKRTVE